MVALWRTTRWYKRQHLSEESPAKPFRVCVLLRQRSLQDAFRGIGSDAVDSSQLAVMTLSPGLGRAGRQGRGTALTVRNRRSFLFSVTRDSDMIAR
ncbi:hypothetical protein TNCV_4645121 [Trichonephila clavipes]|nr:hypothetical protein TNCV_4645121 [Trichonephila clavipes]